VSPAASASATNLSVLSSESDFLICSSLAHARIGQGARRTSGTICVEVVRLWMRVVVLRRAVY
jgi:hypothetical protein